MDKSDCLKQIRTYVCLLLLVCSSLTLQANPVKQLVERISPGASQKFLFQKKNASVEFFELDQAGDKVVIRGNSYVNIAAGLNWYLKYYANIHLTWNCMKAVLPEHLPVVKVPERHETEQIYRYDFNYCTYSYSMAFWDWKRWEQEIDWMALHGINLPLVITGVECVWKNILDKLGYDKGEINKFISGPGFMAWWLMNNLQGWGGPNPDSWYKQQAILQKKIVKRMHEFGIEPVYPGYSGMLPHNVKEKLGLNTSNPGLWGGYQRPAFLQPTDPKFQEIADLYYKEMNRLFGKANYYSMDPFHEGGSVEGVCLDLAGKAIMESMKRNNPRAVWVIQAWQDNPRPAMIDVLNQGDMLVLDLYSESRPQWGAYPSSWHRKAGYKQHDWVYCMLLNFGANVGLHGKMAHVINEFYRAKESPFGKTLKGVGMTMEGIENNPVMFELLMELPWRKERFNKDEWLKRYTQFRYGKKNEVLEQAWLLLSNSIYNCPAESVQEGPSESIFCARPSENTFQVTSFSNMTKYYNPNDVIKAAAMFVSVADEFKDNNNFEYDLIDILRQAIAEKGRLIYDVVMAAYRSGDKCLFSEASERFLQLLLSQDSLLATRSEFRVGHWIAQARSLGKTKVEKDLYEWNARVQITTWGDRKAADDCYLHDYSHREWNGLLKDFYYQRWSAFFDCLSQRLNGNKVSDIDYYSMEEPWTKANNAYDAVGTGQCISTAKSIFNRFFK